MLMQSVRHVRTRAVLYEGAFDSLRHCVEEAVRAGVCLDGANLSESALTGTSFANATLYGTCLSLSDMTGCNFQGALFGGTDIAGALLSRARISTSSALGLAWSSARHDGALFFDEISGKICPISQPPLVIEGLGGMMALMDRHIRIGSACFDLAAIRPVSGDAEIDSFINNNSELLTVLFRCRVDNDNRTAANF